MCNTGWVVVHEEIRKRNPELLAQVTKQEAGQVAFESGQREVLCTQEKTRAEQNVAVLMPLIKDAHAHYRQAKRRAAEEREQIQCRKDRHRQTNLERLADNRRKDKKKQAWSSATQYPLAEKTLTTRMPPAPVPTEPVQIHHVQSDTETIWDQSSRVTDPGFSHTSPPVGVSRAGSCITIEKSPGHRDQPPMDLNSDDKLDILAGFCTHYLLDGEPQYPDMEAMETMEFEYQGTHITHEEWCSAAVPGVQTNLHPVPSPLRLDDEVLDGSTVEVSPSTEEQLLWQEDSLTTPPAPVLTKEDTMTTPPLSPCPDVQGLPMDQS